MNLKGQELAILKFVNQNPEGVDEDTICRECRAKASRSRSILASLVARGLLFRDWLTVSPSLFVTTPFGRQVLSAEGGF